jgi:septum formation protein
VPQTLLLASASPRRRYLLRLLGVRFRALRSGVPEHRRSGESPRHLAQRLAACKAAAVRRRHPRRWVLGADTVVSVAGQVLGIPSNRVEARRMLRALSGRRHVVWTAVALLGAGARSPRRIIAATRVRVAPLSEAEIETYLDSGEWRGKAGAYGIQGRFAAYVRRLEGSYTTVVGLPLEQVRRLLRREGLLPPRA